MQLEYTVKGGGILRGFTKEDIAYALYELSLAPSSSFTEWLQDTASRINTQFGYVIRDQYPNHFVDDLARHGLIMRSV
tara:strand:+ start:1295 stop:1528 length:234 start_codon:yes stop_codon:yes gene_type:complete